MTFCSFLFEEKPNSKGSGRDSFENATVPSQRRKKSKKYIISEKGRIIE